MRKALILHGIIVLSLLCLGFLPLIGVMAVGTIAERYGCQVDEGSVHPCVVNGQDIGQTLYTFGVLGWLMIATIPLGVGAALAYIGLVLLFYLARGLVRRRRATRLA
jgi:hypothetical protein